jgi:hypothetical protein
LDRARGETLLGNPVSSNNHKMKGAEQELEGAQLTSSPDSSAQILTFHCATGCTWPLK